MATTKNKKMQLWAVTAVAGATAVVLAGCASSDGSGSTGGGDSSGVIRVQVEASKLAGYEAVEAGFEEANPELDVQFETITSDQKATTNGLALASGDAPDVGLAPINAPSYTQLLVGDALLPLDDVWEAADLSSRYEQSTIETLAPNGTTPYSVVPETQLYNVVYYNSDIFQELGIEVPEGRQLESADDLYTIINGLDQGGKEGLCIGGTSNYQLGWLFDGQLATSAEPEQLATYLASGQPGSEEVNYDDPAVIAALETIQEWNDNGVFQAGMLGQNYDTALANFSAGTCGAILGTATTVSALESNGVTFGVDWFLLPGIDGPTLPNTYTGSTLVVPKAAANPEGAKRFLEYLVSTEAQIAYVSENGTLPAVTDVDQVTLNDVLPELVNSVLSFVNENGADLGWTSVVPGEMGQAVIDPAIQRQLNGDTTPAETATELQQSYVEFRANNS